MNFLETLKRDADAKYSEMLSGETKSPIETVDIASTTKFVEKNKAYHSRLESEAKQLSQSLDTVEKNKQSRLKLEELKRKQAKEAEEEKRRKQKEEQERIRREAERREAEAAAKKKKIIISCVALAVVVAIIIAIIAGVSSKKKQEAANYGVDNIAISVLSKTNGSQSYNYYTTNFKIKVKNDCKVEITYLECNMLLTAIDTGSELWKGDVRLTGDITPNGGTSTWDVELKSSGNELWNYPLAGLKIQCKITGATFDDYTSKDYSEGYKTIFEGSSNYMETSYQNALNLYNSGKYAEAKDIFEGLGNYKDAATYLDLCEDKVFYQQMETYLHDVAGKNAILPDNYVLYLGYTQNDWYYYEGEDYRAFSADFVVNDSQVSTYLNNFRNKLTSNGFTAVSANVYKKGYTMICFSDIQEGYSSKYIDYYAWQMN